MGRAKESLHRNLVLLEEGIAGRSPLGQKVYPEGHKSLRRNLVLLYFKATPDCSSDITLAART